MIKAICISRSLRPDLDFLDINDTYWINETTIWTDTEGDRYADIYEDIEKLQLLGKNVPLDYFCIVGKDKNCFSCKDLTCTYRQNGMIAKITELITEADKDADRCSGVEYDCGFYVGKGEAFETVLSLLKKEDALTEEPVSKKENLVLYEKPVYMSDEEFEKYKKETEFHFSKEETVAKIQNFLDNNNISQEDELIFSKILKDDEILDKLIFITDGSYRTHRIFYKKSNVPSLMCQINVLYWQDKKNYINMSENDKLKFLKDNYASIFIHIGSDKGNVTFFERY